MTIERKTLRYREIVSRIERIARANISQPLHITALCRAAAVSERTLRTAFIAICGITPYRHLKLIRMASARHALSNGESAATVTDVAMQFGFLELGRFSVEYKIIFGESPSQTLQSKLARSATEMTSYAHGRKVVIPAFCREGKSSENRLTHL